MGVGDDVCCQCTKSFFFELSDSRRGGLRDRGQDREFVGFEGQDISFGLYPGRLQRVYESALSTSFLIKTMHHIVRSVSSRIRAKRVWITEATLAMSVE